MPTRSGLSMRRQSRPARFLFWESRALGHLIRMESLAVSRGGVGPGQGHDEGELLRLDMLVDGEDEGDGEGASVAEPGVGATATAGGLAGGEDYCGGEEFAGFAKSGGLKISRTEGGKI